MKRTLANWEEWAEYQICVCGAWSAFMGTDVSCDECGQCEWAPADADGKEITEVSHA